MKLLQAHPLAHRLFIFLGKNLSIAIIATLCACAESPVGSKKRPFTMYFVPANDAQTIAAGADQISTYITKAVSQKLYQKDSGFYAKASVPTSYIAVVEAFGSAKADFAALTTFSYILAKNIKKYPVIPVVSIVRGHNERTYKAQIITHKDSGITKLADLKGKKFAFTDPASTAGYLLPTKLFRDNGIQLGETVFGQKHDNVVTMVYQRQVDAGATFYSPPEKRMVDGQEVEVIRDARARVKTQFPDVEDKVRIVAFSEEVVNEPWVMRTQLSKDPAEDLKIRTAVVDSLKEYASSPEGKIVLKQLSDATGLVDVDDSAYEPVRKIIESTQFDVEVELKKSK